MHYFRENDLIYSNFQPRIGTRKIHGGAKFSEIKTKKMRVVSNRLKFGKITRNIGCPSSQYEELDCVFFTFKLTFSETGHRAYIILPNNRIGSRDTWLSPCSIWRCSVTTAWRFEFIKVCMETQRFCWKSKFCLYFVNKIYLPCCCVVFFDVCQLLGPI